MIEFTLENKCKAQYKCIGYLPLFKYYFLIYNKKHIKLQVGIMKNFLKNKGIEFSKLMS
jgi:hypothetical protein